MNHLPSSSTNEIVVRNQQQSLVNRATSQQLIPPGHNAMYQKIPTGHGTVSQLPISTQPVQNSPIGQLQNIQLGNAQAFQQNEVRQQTPQLIHQQQVQMSKFSPPAPQTYPFGQPVSHLHGPQSYPPHQYITNIHHQGAQTQMYDRQTVSPQMLPLGVPHATSNLPQFQTYPSRKRQSSAQLAAQQQMIYLQSQRHQVPSFRFQQPSSSSVHQQQANTLHLSSGTQQGAQTNPLAVYQKRLHMSSSQAFPGKIQATDYTPQGIHTERFPVRQPSVQVHGLRNQQQQQHCMNSVSPGHQMKYLRKRQPIAQLVPPNHQQIPQNHQQFMINSPLRHRLSFKQPRLMNSQKLSHIVSCCCKNPSCHNNQMQRFLRSKPNVQYPKLQSHPQQTIISSGSQRSQIATHNPIIYERSIRNQVQNNPPKVAIPLPGTTQNGLSLLPQLNPQQMQVSPQVMHQFSKDQQRQLPAHQGQRMLIQEDKLLRQNQPTQPSSNQANQDLSVPFVSPSGSGTKRHFMSSSQSSEQIISKKRKSESDVSSMNTSELPLSSHHNQAQQGSLAQNELQLSTNDFDDIPVSQVYLFRVI